MSSYSQHKKKISSSESELYLLIAKFLKTGPCKQTADLLTKEIEEHELLPKRIDWLGNEHNRSFNEFVSKK
ncbi:bromodomain and WD repeat-containing protein 3 [Caerostris extrusa]|uniref:Bromodomain and WD repeat-containing protein 3 n=1 Tax=Caerostris extrusa TaxID=172846 RepID=A0AAV4M3X3_CAEEX|nr:bromodomain and WD repeat-containing protein 3 [Caerostris extrusa]